MPPQYGDNEPIAALATPLSESAIALIRTEGPIELLAKIFSRPKALLGAKGHSLVHGWIIDPWAGANNAASPAPAGAAARAGKSETLPAPTGNAANVTSPAPAASPAREAVGANKSEEFSAPAAARASNAASAASPRIDEVLISVYRSPQSYTGGEGADITCHGSIAVIKSIMELLRKAGFRDALPGEFTFRAFMNGKLDLTRAESVMELVASKTDKGREQALRRLSGLLEKEINEIKMLLMEVLAGTEIFLDYSEDEFTGSQSDEEEGKLPGRLFLEEAERRLTLLTELWQRERIYADGALVVLAGRPNSGKSSLFNYLLKEDRSIVTDIPGTTRDWIEALISIEDIPIHLADTAGLRVLNGDQDQKKLDQAESIGIERTYDLIEKADLVLYVIDGTVGITEEDREFLAGYSGSASALLLWNKADLAAPVGDVLSVSAKTGEGISALTRQIASVLCGGAAGAGNASRADNVVGAAGAGASDAAVAGEAERASAAGANDAASASAAGAGEGTAPGTVRQRDLVQAALDAVEEALALAKEAAELELIAPIIRYAVNALGEITGEVYNDDILEIMFSRFCVGK